MMTGASVSATGSGVFVCLEGIDGSGKTTAIATAGELLRQKGFPVVFSDKKEVDFGSSYVQRHMTALQKVIWGHPPDDPYLELGDMHSAFNAAGKPIAFICHAGWVPISAGIIKGRRATSVDAIRDDMVNAGAHWVDEPCVVDGNLISARTPADLGPWMKALLAALASE